MHRCSENSPRQDELKPPRSVAILGLGLMGGSLGLALRRLRPRPFVTAYARRDETRKHAIATRVADKVFDSPAEAVRGAEMVVVCTPVLSVLQTAKECLPGLSRGAVLTDVSSTKVDVVRSMERLWPLFVGSHPIAGSEQNGIEAAKAHLYDGRITVMTPTPRSRALATARVEALWTAAGSRVIRMSPARHDKLLATTSHVPHLVAALLARHVGKTDSETAGMVCGTGFRDTTRIADGLPSMWLDIVKTNATQIAEDLETLETEMRALRRMLAKKDFKAVLALLEDARKTRRAMLSLMHQQLPMRNRNLRPG